MTVSDYIEIIKTEFSHGKRYIELPSSDPHNFRKRIYEASRRRGLLWMFATCEKSIFVIATV